MQYNTSMSFKNKVHVFKRIYKMRKHQWKCSIWQQRKNAIMHKVKVSNSIWLRHYEFFDVMHCYCQNEATYNNFCFTLIINSLIRLLFNGIQKHLQFRTDKIYKVTVMWVQISVTNVCRHLAMWYLLVYTHRTNYITQLDSNLMGLIFHRFSVKNLAVKIFFTIITRMIYYHCVKVNGNLESHLIGCRFSVASHKAPYWGR